MANHRPDDVLAFWFGEGAEYGKRHERWFEKDAAFDAEVTARFRDLHSRLLTSNEWLDPARACLDPLSLTVVRVGGTNPPLRRPRLSLAGDSKWLRIHFAPLCSGLFRLP